MVRARRRISVGAVGGAIALLTLACGLSTMGTGATPSGDDDSGLGAEGAPAPDGSPTTSSDAAEDTVAISDGRAVADVVDAADSHACVPVEPDAGVTGALDISKFVTVGSASYNENLDGRITLTNSNHGESGASWSPTLLPVVTRFALSFTLRVGAGNTGGDGIAFAVLQGSGSPGVGDNGDGIGLRKLAYSGYAVVVDMYKNTPTDDATTTLKLVTMPDFTIVAHAGLDEALNDSNDHVVDVSLQDGTLSATVHGPTLMVSLSQFDAGFATTAPAYFGFTGSTGGGADSHNEVVGITVTSACR